MRRLSFTATSKRPVPHCLGQYVIDRVNPSTLLRRIGSRVVPFIIVRNSFLQVYGGSLAQTSLTQAQVSASGVKYGRYVGRGSSVCVSGQSNGRIYQIEISLSDPIALKCQVSYQAATDVDREGIEITLPPTGFWVDGQGFAVGSQCYWDYGSLTPHFIVLPNGTRQYKNYQTRQSGQRQFIVCGSATPRRVAPIKMLQPNGYLATFIWTNHADSQNAARLRALCYGASDPEDPDYGTKGFVGRGIKATLSTFAYADSPSSVGLLQDPEFYELMEDLRDLGYEIIPHRIRSGPSETREDVESALPTFAAFGARNWIDHSLDHEERCCGLHNEGGLEGSDYYIMDLLAYYGYEYTWNYVDIPRQKGINQVPPWLVGLPISSFYKNTNLKLPSGEPIWKWSTWTVRTDNLLPIITESAIDELIDDFGLSIVHCYLPYPGQNYYWYDDDGILRVTPEFDSLLAYMASKQNQGKLYVPNCVDWCDYMAQIHNVRIEAVEGAYKLINSNGAAVSGFALRVPYHGQQPYIEGVTINSKLYNGWLIFWLDLPVGESLLMFN